MKRLFRLGMVLAVIVLLVWQLPAYSQQPPPADTAVAEQQRFQDNVRRDKEALGGQTPGPADIRKLTGASSEITSDVKFALQQIRFTGNTLIPSDDLKFVTDKYVGREVSLRELDVMVSAIKLFFRRKGYISMYAVIPPQKLKDGVLEVQIVEGTLGELSITGNKYFSEKIIARQVGLTSGSVITESALSGGLYILNEHPDIEARSVLRPGIAQGTTDVEIQVQDRSPFHLMTGMNDLGTRNTGRERYSLAALHSNVTGHLDELSGRVQVGTGALGLGTDYSIPVGAKGVRAGFSTTYSTAKVGGQFKSLNLKGRAATYSPYLTMPLMVKPNWSVTGRTELDWKVNKNYSMGTRSGEDQLRILHLGLLNQGKDHYGRTYLPVDVEFGLPVWGASDNNDEQATRSNTGSEFTVMHLGLARYNKFLFGSILSVRSNLQLTDDTLPSSERMPLGGAFSVRGYSEGAFMADYGATFATEVLIPLTILPDQWMMPFTKDALQKRIQFELFLDTGAGRNRSWAVGEARSQVLSGAGVGLRVGLFKNTYGKVEWAQRLGDKIGDGGNTEIYYSIGMDLF